MALAQFEEKKIVDGLCKCEDFQEFIKDNYTIQFDVYTTYTAIRTVKLVRNKDNKVLAEWNQII